MNIVPENSVNSYSTVGEYVYEEIRNFIINWQLKPGQRISEAEMSKVLDVSRTPVREGFIRLKNEGLVEILAQRGTLISKIDLKKAREGVFIRSCLEKEVIREICGKVPEEFIEKGIEILRRQEESYRSNDFIKFHKYDVLLHKLFYDIAEKEYTWEFIKMADTHYDRIRMLTLLDFDKSKSLHEDHTGIFNAIVEGDFEKASKQLQDHIDLVHQEIKILKKEYGDYFIDGE